MYKNVKEVSQSIKKTPVHLYVGKFCGKIFFESLWRQVALFINSFITCPEALSIPFGQVAFFLSGKSLCMLCLHTWAD